MTSSVYLKRFTLSLLLISVLVNCDMWKAQFGREEVNVGAYITLQVETTVDGQETRWIFAQLPDSSKLGGFLPSDTLDLVSFKPDVPGDYDIILQITLAGELEETSYFYEAMLAEDSSMVDSEIPEHLANSVYAEDTTVADTQSVVSMTDTGAQRRYLSKVVSPSGSSSATKSSSRSYTPRKKSTSKPSRGNLIPRATKSYTIQVSSWPSLEAAQAASGELLENYGIESYIQRAFFKDKDEIYYRLRIGNFPEEADAKAYAKEIQSMTSLPVWVDYIRKEM